MKQQLLTSMETGLNAPNAEGHLSTGKQEGGPLNTMSLRLEDWLFAKPCRAQSCLLPIYRIQGGPEPLQDL